METEDENYSFYHDYDDEHDSDVEARLYAQIYHSNTIIGEENNENNPLYSNQNSDTINHSNKISSMNANPLYGIDNNQQNSDVDIIRDKNVAVPNGSINHVTNQNNDVEHTNMFSRESISTQRFNNSNSTKRASNDFSNEANVSNKKKKAENYHDTRESQTNQVNESSSTRKPNQEKNNAVLHGADSLINPYNKQILDSTGGLKLLSTEVLNLFFGKQRKKNMKNQALKKVKDVTVTRPKPNIPLNSLAVLQPSNVEQIDNGTAADSLTESAVIDISSESSNDAFEDDSKYNKIVATDQKLKERETELKNTIANDSSDGEESIFEVPIPPKPAPPVIEVRDSDNELENQDGSDENSFLNNSIFSQASVVEDSHEISLTSTMNKTNDTCEIISDSEDSNNLILNCTGVQKGVSTLGEIKKINRQTVNFDRTVVNRNLNSNNTQQNVLELTNNSTIHEKSVNGSRSKQKSTSRKNMSIEEYFFQPMTEKMKSFYDNSWGGENFDMNAIKSKMSTDPNKWAILNKDLVFTGPKRKRYFGMTCARCHRDGHRQNDCPEPIKGPTCYMCGFKGHFVTNCPQTKCLTCGRRTTMYRTTCAFCEKLFCRRCRSQGHLENSCPDLWRRYHDTTSSDSPTIPRHVKNVTKHWRQIFCSNCTKQGHDSADCRKLRWSQHFPNPSSVIHYGGPIYNTITHFGSPITVGDVQEQPTGVNSMHNNLSNSNQMFTSFPRSDRRDSCSTTLNNSSTGFPRSDGTSIHDRIGYPSNIPESSKNIIFNIYRNNVDFHKDSMKSVTLKLNVPNGNVHSSVENWKKLSEFLNQLLFSMPGEFRLERKDKQLLMYLKSPRKYTTSLSILIKQYASRTSFERSQMFLNGNRNLQEVAKHLTRKFAGMKNMKEDILTLYESIRRLSRELPNRRDDIVNEVQSRSKLNELALSQQKLITLLHREGFGDESLGQLRKIFLKLEKSIEGYTDKNLKKPPRRASNLCMSFKSLFTYLYYYNNIFVPYESSQLDSFVQKYKDHLHMQNRLLNSSLLFPQDINMEQNSSHKMPTQVYTLNDKALSEDASKSLPSTSQKLPVMQNNIIEAYVEASNDHSNIIDCAEKKSESAKRKKQNHLYFLAMHAKNEKIKQENLTAFKNFIKNTRKSLAAASRLNLPNLCNDIDDLKRELEDEIYLPVSKVTKFRKKMKKEMREQAIPEKLKENSKTDAKKAKKTNAKKAKKINTKKAKKARKKVLTDA